MVSSAVITLQDIQAELAKQREDILRANKRSLEDWTGMILLNIGAGGTLPPRPWVNVDYPHEHNDMENYVRHDASTPLPFADNYADGLIACHFIEHFECLKAVEILREFYRVLKPGGVCRIVVPDASYHRKVYSEDLADPIGNAMRLFGEPLAGRDRAKQLLTVGRLDQDATFMSFALFWADHKQLFTEDSLWCEMVQAGFEPEKICGPAQHQRTEIFGSDSHQIALQVAQLDNRELFSLRMEAVK